MNSPKTLLKEYDQLLDSLSTDNAKSRNLEIIQKELHILREICHQNGISPGAVEKSSKSLFNYGKPSIRARLLWWGKCMLPILIGIVVFVCLIWYTEWMYWSCFALLRRTLVVVLPFWDWTVIRDSCLVRNPFFNPDGLSEDDCQSCLNQTSFIYWAASSNSSDDALMKLMMDDKLPVLFQGGAQQWPAIELFSFSFLYNLFASNVAFQNGNLCQLFTVGLRFEHPDQEKEFVMRVFAKEFKGIAVHWENCFIPASKEIRQFTRRPSFLPSAIELSTTNQLLIANEFKVQDYQPLNSLEPWGLFAQIKGSSKMRFRPRGVCERFCDDVRGEVHTGDIVVWNDELYMVDYIPQPEGESIAFSVGLNM